MSLPAPQLANYQAYRRNLTDVIVDSLDDIRRAIDAGDGIHRRVHHLYNLIRPWVKADKDFNDLWNEAADRWEEASHADKQEIAYSADMEQHALIVTACYEKAILIRPGLSVDDEELPIGVNGRSVADEAAPE